MLPKSYDLNSHVRTILSTVFSFETVFVLYLFAGFFKASEFLGWVPIDLTLLLLVGSVLAGAYVFWKRGLSISRRALSLTIAMAVFSGWVLLSLLWAPPTRYGLEKALQFVVLNGWTLAGATVILDGDKQRLSRFYGILMGLAFLFSLESLRIYLPHMDVRSYVVFGSSYQNVGRLVGLGFVIAIAAFARKDGSFWRSGMFLAMSALFFFVLLLVGARGPFFAAVMGLMLILALSRARVSKKALLVMMLGVIYLAGSFAMGPSLRTMYRFNVILAHEVGWQLPGATPTPTPIPTSTPKPAATSQASVPSKEETHSMSPESPTSKQPKPTPKPRIPPPIEIPNESMELRQMRFVNAIKLWLTAPLVGAGVGSFAYYYPAEQFRVYPHNMVLEILSELGIVGAILWFAMFVVAFWCLAKMRRWRETLVIAALGFFTFTFLNAMISGDIASNRHVFTSLGLLVATCGLWGDSL